MKKYYAIIFGIIIISFSLLLVFLPKKEFSEDENRYLETFPKFTIKSITNGNFMEGLEDYIQDHFAFRTFFLNLKTNTELAMLKDENNNVYFADNGYLIEKNNKPDYSQIDRIIKVLNTFKSNNNIKTSIILVPTSITINSDLLPKNATVYSELELIEYIYSNLDVSFNKLTIYEELLKLKEQNIQIYYKLDHHWTTRASYEAYKKYMGEEAININEFEKETVTNDFKGTTYSKANLYNIKPDSIDTYTLKDTDIQVKFNNEEKVYTSVYFTQYLQMKDKYSFFLNSNQALVTIKNNKVQNNKKILIIKDSYANCFVPFILNNFEETHVIDPRYYLDNISEYILNNDINEVLIIYNTSTLPSDLGIYNVK